MGKYITKREINEFVERVMDDPSLYVQGGPVNFRGQDDWSRGREAEETYKNRLGRKVWYLQNRLAKRYGCEACRPNAQMLFNGSHDAVNIYLGKPIHNAQNWKKFVMFVNEMNEMGDN